MAKAAAAAAPVDGTNVVIARALGLFILLLSPVCTILLKDKKGDVYDKKHYSSLEISGMSALQMSPSLRPAVQAALFLGMTVRQLTKVSLACYTKPNSPNCNWKVMAAEDIWEASDIPDDEVEDWLKAVGDKHGLIAAACAAVNFGGLAGLMVPVKMVTGGLLLLVLALYFTPSCVMLPNLMLMCFLGVMMLLSDVSASSKADKKPKQAPKPKAAASSAASPASKATSKQKQKKAKAATGS